MESIDTLFMPVEIILAAISYFSIGFVLFSVVSQRTPEMLLFKMSHYPYLQSGFLLFAWPLSLWECMDFFTALRGIAGVAATTYLQRLAWPFLAEHCPPWGALLVSAFATLFFSSPLTGLLLIVPHPK